MLSKDGKFSSNGPFGLERSKFNFMSRKHCFDERVRFQPVIKMRILCDALLLTFDNRDSTRLK
jgi:hypothetical protein